MGMPVPCKLNAWILFALSLKIFLASPEGFLAAQDSSSEWPSYATITKHEAMKGVKCVVELTLTQKISEAELEDLAERVRALTTDKYPRTFISYRLAWGSEKKPFWATTDFNPGLEVRILGLSMEEERKILERPLDPSWNLIGKWTWESTVGSVLVIYKIDGNVFMDRCFADGTSTTIDLLEYRSGDQRRFEKIGSKSKEHWVIDASGDLEIRDRDGMFARARNVTNLLEKIKEKEKLAKIAAEKEREEHEKDLLQKKQKRIDKLSGFRTWKDTTGRFRVTAKFLRQTKESVFLEKDDGDSIEVLIEKLSDTDKKLLSELRYLME
jgi:hypothetical protein